MRAFCAALVSLLTACALLAATPAHADGVRLVVVHASMQNTDPIRLQRVDFERELHRGADVITFTEADRLTAGGWARRAADRAGYRLVSWGQEAVAVARRTGRVTAHGARLVLRGVSGQYPDRGVLWVTVQLRAGQMLTVLATHLNTRGLYSRARDAGNRRIMRVAGAIARQRAAWGHMVVGGGDLNYPLPKGHPLHRTGLSMSWRPVGTFAATLGRLTYDAVLFKPSKRLRVLSARALGGPRAKDHRSIVTVFEVTD